MNTTHAPAARPRPPLSRVDQAILALHGIVACVLGTAAFLGADDPEFGSLQRIVVVMIIGLWLGGIVLMGVITRYVIRSRWGRITLLLFGPFVGIALLIGSTHLG